MITTESGPGTVKTSRLKVGRNPKTPFVLPSKAGTHNENLYLFPQVHSETTELSVGVTTKGPLFRKEAKRCWRLSLLNSSNLAFGKDARTIDAYSIAEKEGIVHGLSSKETHEYMRGARQGNSRTRLKQWRPDAKY